MPKTVALFVDVQTLHHQLRTKHHRFLDPALLLETAGAHGQVAAAVAIANWADVPSDYPGLFEAQEMRAVQVDRKNHGMSTRRREVMHDMVGMELLAQVIELLFPLEGGSEVDELIVASGEDACCRIIDLVRERFNKDVRVIGVEGAMSEKVQEHATSWEALPMPPIEPTDMEGLEKLVPMLEELEKKKRYLNFKYIRETVVRRLDLPEKSFEAAERLLSEAIACGLLLKRKIEDKYNPGQLFTAYALDRESPWFEELGSGEPAPVHPEEPEPSADAKREKPKRTRERKEREPRNDARNDDEGDGDEKRGRKRRRRKRSGSKDNAEAPPSNVSLSAGNNNANGKRGRRRKKGGQQHQQDRVGRNYEAPSRFLQDPTAAKKPVVNDDDIDEDRILAALTDL